MESEYDQSVDVWSIGCILGDLLLYLKTKSDWVNCQIFPGKHCYPLSPVNILKMNPTKITQKDQLYKILKVMGPLKSEDISFVTT